MPTADDETRRRFVSYLEASMHAAGFVKKNGELNVAALARASGVHDVVLRRWLSMSVEPTISNLRRIAPVLRREPRELVVAAGIMTAEEVGLSGDPVPPPAPPTTEEAIAADPRLTRRGKETLLYLAERFATERESEREAQLDEDDDDAPVQRRA